VYRTYESVFRLKLVEEFMAIENKNRNAQEDASIEVAEASRETTWKSKSYMGSIFLGDFDISMAFPFPEQDPEDKKIGDQFCAKIEEWCIENLDGDEIDRTEIIPAHIWVGLKELNLFAIKIPKEYGGLGLSQTNYMRILSLVALFCGSTTATLSAHQSIGVPQPLKLAGTKEQKEKWLPKFAEGWVSAFALTEPNAGSDPANMTTTATLSEDGSHWIINGEKLWCTNGVVADIIVVMAVSGTKETRSGRKINKISAFLVETDTPGCELMYRCGFMGIKAIENGILRFTDCKIPAENLIGGEGKGLKLALATLNDGRLSIPAIAAQGANYLAEFSASWGKTREQWGKNIGQHEPGSEKIAKIASSAYAMSALSDYCASLSDKEEQDMRMEAAAAKMFNTEILWDVVDNAIQLRGGRGYETSDSLKKRGELPIPMERAMRDARINRIVEGTTDIMHLFLAREALDWHLGNAGTLFGRASLGEKVKTIVKCAGIYSMWLPKLMLPSFFKSFPGFHPKLKPFLRKIDSRTKKLARTMFAQMLILGPKLESRQLILARLVDIGTELAVMGLTASRIQSQMNNGDKQHLKTVLYWLHSSTIRVDRLFREINTNADAQARQLARELMDRAELLPEVDNSHLQPIQREFGKDLTSGKITKRRREIESTSIPKATNVAK
jgi:alkylation response protein AidB-like acyl-CoA dehydrogenase